MKARVCIPGYVRGPYQGQRSPETLFNILWEIFEAICELLIYLLTMTTEKNVKNLKSPQNSPRGGILTSKQMCMVGYTLAVFTKRLLTQQLKNGGKLVLKRERVRWHLDRMMFNSQDELNSFTL